MLEKARAKNKKPKSSAGISSIPNITVGTQVRIMVWWSSEMYFICKIQFLELPYYMYVCNHLLNTYLINQSEYYRQLLMLNLIFTLQSWHRPCI